MGLIETRHGPFFLSQLLVLDIEQGVGGDHHVASRSLIDSLLTVIGCIEDRNVERRCESLQLIAPVGHHRGRCHYQRRPVGSLIEQQSDGLQSLSQSHVVGQTGTGSPRGDAPHPFIALHLIVTQIGLQRVGHLRLSLGTVLDALTQGVKFLAACHLQVTIVEQVADQTGSCRCHLQVVTTVRRDGVETLEHTFQVTAQTNEFLFSNFYVVAMALLMHQLKQLLQGDDLVLINAHVALNLKPSVFRLKRDIGRPCADGWMVFQTGALRPLQFAHLRIVLAPLNDLKKGRRVGGHGLGNGGRRKVALVINDAKADQLLGQLCHIMFLLSQVAYHLHLSSVLFGDSTHVALARHKYQLTEGMHRHREVVTVVVGRHTAQGELRLALHLLKAIELHSHVGMHFGLAAKHHDELHQQWLGLLGIFLLRKDLRIDLLLKGCRTVNRIVSVGVLPVIDGLGQSGAQFLNIGCYRERSVLVAVDNQARLVLVNVDGTQVVIVAGKDTVAANETTYTVRDIDVVIIHTNAFRQSIVEGIQLQLAVRAEVFQGRDGESLSHRPGPALQAFLQDGINVDAI